MVNPCTWWEESGGGHMALLLATPTPGWWSADFDLGADYGLSGMVRVFESDEQPVFPDAASMGPVSADRRTLLKKLPSTVGAHALFYLARAKGVRIAMDSRIT